MSKGPTGFCRLAAMDGPPEEITMFTEIMSDIGVVTELALGTISGQVLRLRLKSKEESSSFRFPAC